MHDAETAVEGFTPARRQVVRCGSWPGRNGLWLALNLAAAVLNPHLRAAAQSQSTGSTAAAVALSVRAPAAIQAAPSSRVALAIVVAPLDALPPQSFLRVSGLPSSVSLTEGYAIAAGSWAVPLNSLGALKANLPATPGSTAVTLQLVSLEGVVLAQTQLTLIVAALGAPAFTGASLLSTPRPLSALPRLPALSAAERDRAEKLKAQGDRYLESGNVAIARQFFQRAAEAGLAAGAMRLAGTFDPDELARLRVQGVVPSPAQARHWYERARELGAPDADERLARISQ